MISTAMTASVSQSSQTSEQSDKNADKPFNRPSLPSKLFPNLAGRSFYVPAVVGGIPMSFLYDTGANLAYVNEGTVDIYGLQSFFRDCRDKKGRGIRVKTASGEAESSTCIVTEMVFQGATRKTVIHIIPSKEPIFLLGTDVTLPKGGIPSGSLSRLRTNVQMVFSKLEMIRMK
jgi:hypothetical protein